MAYATALHVMADPTRRKVLETLARGPSSVGEIAARLPVSRPAVSQHLKALEAAGLVHARRRGTRRIYRADPAALGELRAYVEALWREALAAVAAESENRGGTSG
jgi:DNA-binding transcriptional ArsR family regulator